MMFRSAPDSIYRIGFFVFGERKYLGSRFELESKITMTLSRQIRHDRSPTCASRSLTGAIFVASTAARRTPKIIANTMKSSPGRNYAAWRASFRIWAFAKCGSPEANPWSVPAWKNSFRILRALGVEDISMTTNGHLLADRCDGLIAAGLHRINISLDSLDPVKFERITRTKSFVSVMRGIDAIQSSAIAPAKVNAVLVRGINDDEVENFAAFARERGVIMRFIEFMPLDADRHWTRDVVVSAPQKFIDVSTRAGLWNKFRTSSSETARKYRFADGMAGEIGLIAPVTQPFCGHCSRIRLTADGKIRTCLFSKEDHDLRSLLREGACDEDLEIFIRSVVMEKEEGHHINDKDFRPPSRTMVFIGG